MRLKTSEDAVNELSVAVLHLVAGLDYVHEGGAAAFGEESSLFRFVKHQLLDQIEALLGLSSFPDFVPGSK